jgi:glycerol-3-phosphate dehydrogenase subunit B
LDRSIVVIGGGLAGLAAAWSARRRGLRVAVVSRGAGASALAGGAVDDIPWERRERDTPVAALPAPVHELSAELGLWDLPATSIAVLATLAGRIRPARGRDRALLDLRPLCGTRVLLPRVERPGWDADALAATLTADPFAQARGLRFVAVDMPVLRFDDERRIADGDLAARHDEPSRLEWLAGSLRWTTTRQGAGAVLLGPWLGARAGRAEALTALAGLPTGEALAGAGSPAGLRFEVARDALLAALDVRRVQGHAVAVDAAGEPRTYTVRLERDGLHLTADAVVLAIGGMISGGVEYLPPLYFAGPDLPAAARVPFALAVSAPVRLGDGRAPLEVVSSLHGPQLDTAAWPAGSSPGLLESVGVLCHGVRAGAGIYAAGDIIAGRPRTAIEALVTGLRAGNEA